MKIKTGKKKEKKEAQQARPCQPDRPCAHRHPPATEDYSLWVGPLDKGCVAVLLINTGDEGTVKCKTPPPGPVLLSKRTFPIHANKQTLALG